EWPDALAVGVPDAHRELPPHRPAAPRGGGPGLPGRRPARDLGERLVEAAVGRGGGAASNLLGPPTAGVAVCGGPRAIGVGAGLPGAVPARHPPRASAGPWGVAGRGLWGGRAQGRGGLRRALGYPGSGRRSEPAVGAVPGTPG